MMQVSHCHFRLNCDPPDHRWPLGIQRILVWVHWELGPKVPYNTSWDGVTELPAQTAMDPCSPLFVASPAQALQQDLVVFIFDVQ